MLNSQCTFGNLRLPHSRASPYVCIHSQNCLQAVNFPLYAAALLIAYVYIIPFNTAILQGKPATSTISHAVLTFFWKSVKINHMIQINERREDYVT